MKEPPADPATIYGKEYYDHMCAVPYDRDQPVWRDHFHTLARTLVERYHPKTVMDIGCAKGFLVEHLRDLSVNACGVDASPYAISQVRKDIRPFCHVARGNDALEGRFDLITCIEVAEHMVEADARAMIEESCRHTDQVIFSSTPDDFEEPTHINLHPPEYWVALFQEQGFYRDANFQPEFVTPQAMRFVRCVKPVLQVGVFSHEPPNCAVALLRLGGIIRYLERQKRLRLAWCTARDPQVDVEKLLDSDVFVLHREFADYAIRCNAVAAARALGKPIVFELDDLLINVPESNPNHRYCTSIRSNVLSMLCEADFVTVTTEPLRRYLEEAEPMAKGKTYVLPNYINLDIWDGAKPPPPESPKPFVIGWFGTATHDEDLAIIKPAIVELARKYRDRLIFKFWGYLPKDLEGIPGVQLVRGSQPDLRLHARDVVNSRIDLALAPLMDHPFNHAKSDLKWLEYSICYIPAIYSTLSPYTASVKHGETGWLADNRPELWVEAIESLMRDDDLRRKIAVQAHNEVRHTRCVQTGAELWDALYRSFYVSGPKPREIEAEPTTAPRDRAAAHLMLHQAKALSQKGLHVEAAKVCAQAVTRCFPGGSVAGEFVTTALQSYRNVLRESQQTADLTARLNAARSVAKAGHTQTAVQLCIEALQAAKQSQNPLIVFRAVLEVAESLRTLNPELGRQLLELGATLARNLRIEGGAEAIENLRARYGRTPASVGPERKVNSAEKVMAPPAADTAGDPLATNATSQPAASIVIPTFNNLSLTQLCLQSLSRAQTALKFEVIVVDNASTDGTSEFLRQQEEAGRLRLLGNASNQGFARACNQGAAAALGKHVLFLNNDTRVTPGWLEAMIEAGNRPRVGIVGAKLLYTDNRIQHAGIGFIHGVPDHLHRYAAADAPEVNRFRELDMVTGACLLVRRELFLQLAGFDEVFRNGVEDIDLCLRARTAGWKVAYEPKAVVYHLEGLSAGRFNHVRENLRMFFDRWGQSFDAHQNFIPATPAKVMPASRSLCLEKAGKIGVAWIGSFFDHGSLSHVNRELTGALRAFPAIELQRVATGGRAAPVFEGLARGISIAPSPAPCVTVRHAWPPDWKRPAQGKLAVIQPWEFGSLPREWVNRAGGVDEFWVPSSFVRNCYIASGVPAEKVFVVPNGVDPARFHPQVPPMELATARKFKFLFVGGTIGRKGPDLLLKAYLGAFSKADEVCLVIKDFGGDSIYQGQTFEDQIRAAQSAPNAPEILYLNEEWAPDRLPGLYAACDCLVLPYRGEGFGLPVLEAMACGLPVIVTAGGATDDFARDEFAYRIPAVKNVFGSEVSGMKLAGEGWLLEPDLAALGQIMRHVFNHPAEARERGRLASRHAHQHSSWKNAAAITAQRIQKLAAPSVVQAEPTAKPMPAEPPALAHAGHLAEARELFGQKKPEEAWAAAALALSRRPFHPEAFLLLAEIGLAVGDGVVAKRCAQRARDLAPKWKAPKRFLQRPLKENTRPDWLRPEAISNLASQISNRLTVCVIAKNEEKFLGQCLKSVREVASQIVVVDTGSTDRTVEIAKEHGAEVYHFEWCDDFAAARNAALEHATGDWVLMLDADEELRADQHARLRTDMSQANAVAFRLPLADCGKEDQGQSYVPRLFRNLPGAFYYGRIHEQVFPSLITASKGWGLVSRLGTARIVHHGYSGEVVKDRNKVERNLRLLRQAVREYPEEANLAMNLGLELVRSGDLPAGLTHYREAFRLMSGQLPDGIVPELREVLLTQFTCHLYQGRNYDEVVRTLQSPLAKHGGLTASLHFALGLAHFELHQYEEAVVDMRRCLAQQGERSFAPINTDVLTAAPDHCLAVSLARLGDNAAAEKSFGAGLKKKERVEELRLDYARFLRDQSRPIEALQQLHEVVRRQEQNAPAWLLGGEIALSKPEFLEFARDWSGEALRRLPRDKAVIRQRAEAVMLSGDTKSALSLWQQIFEAEREQGSLAALILCRMAESQGACVPEGSGEEQAASLAFVGWYQKLVRMKAHAIVRRLNEEAEKLSQVLPTAAQMLTAALDEARACVAA